MHMLQALNSTPTATLYGWPTIAWLHQLMQEMSQNELQDKGF